MHNDQLLISGVSAGETIILKCEFSKVFNEVKLTVKGNYNEILCRKTNHITNNNMFNDGFIFHCEYFSYTG